MTEHVRVEKGKLDALIKEISGYVKEARPNRSNIQEPTYIVPDVLIGALGDLKELSFQPCPSPESVQTLVEALRYINDWTILDPKIRKRCEQALAQFQKGCI